MSPAAVLDGEKLAAARFFAASRAPYLATALFAVPLLAAPGSGTVAVDRRWHLLVDPAVLAGLGTQELGRLFVHLVGHLLRDHADRAEAAGVPGLGGRPAAWNRAADAETNDDFVGAGLVPECAGELPAGLGAEAGHLAEEYYGLVGPGPRRWDCGSGCDGVPRPWDCEGGRDKRDAEWFRLVVACELRRCSADHPGSVPAGWLRWAEAVLPSKTDWRRVLAAELRLGVERVAGMVDYSYRKPSRRAGSAPAVIFPSLVRPVPEVAVVCDTSGSMSAEQLGKALVEVEALLRQLGLRNVSVLACDAAVHAISKVARASDVLLAGGGGTDMGEGIARALALRPRPSVVVVLTDGYTPWPPEPVRSARVIVGLIRRGPAGGGFWDAPPQWARTVHLDID